MSGMKLGVYTAILHDRPLREALEVIASLGLTGAEINAGGFLPSPHLPVNELLSGALSPHAYLKVFAETGVELTGLNVKGNPLDPGPGGRPGARRRPAPRRPGRRTDRHTPCCDHVRPAGRRGVRPHPGLERQPMAQHSAYLDSLEYQWDTVAVPFWRDIEAPAAEHGGVSRRGQGHPCRCRPVPGQRSPGRPLPADHRQPARARWPLHPQ